MSKYLEVMKCKAIKLKQNMPISYLSSDEVDKLDLPLCRPKTYNIECGKIIFIDERLNMYSIPNIPGSKALLVCNDYRRDFSLEVPFSSSDSYPTEHKDKWFELIAEMYASTVV